MSGFLGCGDVYVDRKVGGVWQGFVNIGNATKFELKASSELKQRISKSCGSYGQPIDSVTIQQPAELSIALDDLKKENMAIAFLGDASVEVVAASTVTDEVVTVVTPGALIELAGGNISGLVMETTDGLTTYTAGDDYVVVNANVGLIEIVSGGAIVAGDVHASYATGEITSDLVTGGTNPDVKLRYKLVGTNLADQSGVQVDVWESNAAPQSGIDFLADDFTNIEINGSANIDADKGNPYEVRGRVVNA